MDGRRIATGYDKLAANYLAFVKLASIRIWLRASESASWARAAPTFTALTHRMAAYQTRLFAPVRWTNSVPSLEVIEILRSTNLKSGSR
jgi:hypothetical protein